LDHLAPLLVISPARRPRKDTVYSVDGTLVPTRDRSVAAFSENYRYSTNLQVVIDANSRLVVAIGLPQPGSRNNCWAFTESGIDRACCGAPTITEGNLALNGNKVGQYDPRTNKLREFTTPTPLSAPCDLNNQQDGAIQFAELTGNRVARLDIGGA
jgi:hypothetical protein